MGLTVHYRLSAEGLSADEARRIVERLQECATTLPFAEVGPVKVIQAEPAAGAWPHGLQMLQRGERWYDVLPSRGFYFRTLPGVGAETAVLGLCEYPKTIVIEEGRRVRTKLTGWSWMGFCKTQYAGNPRHGGVENFVRAHVALIDLLDQARELGLETDVTDEGGYAERRDVAALRREVDQWNGLVAGVVGVLKDALPGDSESPILDYPNFERLEAKGRERP